MARSFLTVALTLSLLAGCMSPLQKAAFRGDDGRIRELLDGGAKIDDTPYQDMTPLMWAATTGRKETVKLLLDRGAKIDATDSERRTALSYAANEGDLDMVKLLTGRGAELFLLDAHGRSASTVAREHGFLEVQHYLEDAERHASALALSKEELQKAVGEEIKKAREQALTAKPDKQSDVDLPTYRLAERPNAYALVVGIERYKSLPDADYALRDADAVRRHLEALGYPRRNIIYLVGPNATRSAMQSYLEEWLPKNVKADSDVFIYFSGHGAPDLSSAQAFLAPWDADPAFLKTTGYSTHKLYGNLAELKAKNVVVALDACFSGVGGRSVLPKGARPLVAEVLTGLGSKDNISVFTASSEKETTAALEEQGHGIFTYFFLKGLSGKAADAKGEVTADGLYWYLKPLIEEEARRQNRDQTPLLVGSPGATSRPLAHY